jgi:hypothetical protein
MKDNFLEECSVCYRSYSSTVVPISLVCGHSFCAECSTGLRKCPLCRQTLNPRRTKPTNFTLLSLVSKLENDKKEMVDKEIQTEKVEVIIPRTIFKHTPRDSKATMAMKVLIKIANVQNNIGRCLLADSKSYFN